MRKVLNNKAKKLLLTQFEGKYGREPFSKKDVVEQSDDIVYCNGIAMFFTYQGVLLPTLRFPLVSTLFPTVTVDKGAVSHIANGADVMRPGIIAIDEGVEKDSYVVVVDPIHHKALSLCVALYTGTVMAALEKGKVLRTIHYVGDEVWKA